jgi:hypothetical protein
MDSIATQRKPLDHGSRAKPNYEEGTTMSRTSNSKTRASQAQDGYRLDVKVIGGVVGVFFGLAGLIVLTAWGYGASGLAGPSPQAIKDVIVQNYQIQGIGWDGDGRDNGVGVFNVGTHAYGISVDGTVHTCLANMEQAQAKPPIICKDKFVVQPNP